VSVITANLARVTLYGQCDGIGVSCYMGVKTDGVGWMV
jgi:hypothetical protein